MNRPIRGLAIGCMVMFLALLLNATYVQYYWSGDLNQRPDNKRVRDAEFSRERGSIVVGGRPVARSVPSDDQYEFQRSYPEPFKYAHATGFFSYEYAASATEQAQNEILSGSDSRLFVNTLVDVLSNSKPQGGSVVLTLDEGAQSAAYDGLQQLGSQTKGAVVAIQPATGKILAMVSNPSFDPNVVASHDLSEARAAYQGLVGDEANPMQNRGVQEIYPPGSTFKLVTAAAALESGAYTPDTPVPGGATLPLPGSSRELPNSNGGTCGGEQVTLTQALRVSCNVAFGAIGIDVGEDALRETAEKFGFGTRLLTQGEAQAASAFPDELDDAQTALSAIGQFDVASTPLQMALVAATIANNGRGMVPYLVDEVRAPDLSVLDKTQPAEMPEQALSSRNAAQLTEMMVDVVTAGTGRSAAIPGIPVAGKTGTAQSTPERPPYAWFVSFAPADKPQVAVAVLVEDAGVDRNAISGGGLAAPIARAVMQTMIP